ncbi:type II secretion system protein M [Pantoea sp. SOD02]|uniref:type II secretion system protein M n=1 Tax=Pantoea sp. SOD02 TaxID=2970818 RepID=UPI0021588250|nr:type II secretion system protein M [Pantoea sp. SOD02]UVC32128.1 type II secretion system protein M [Pantoea sp. SOD02]
MTFLSGWWQTRQPRERGLLLVAMLIGLGLMLQLSWQQADEYRAHSQQAFAREQQALQLLPTWEAALQKYPPSGEAPSTEALNVLAQQQGLALEVESHHHRWQLKQAVTISFPVLLQWLNELDGRWGIEVSELKMHRDKQHVRLTHLELKHAE